ncbi:MAG: PKD domain-containing protein [Flavobacteriia bacterium]|nr:PKD domain-containing protein [Flavobacteriia bacterium]
MKGLLFSISVFFFFTATAQEVWMTPNHGQWEKTIDYAIPVNSGRIYLSGKGLTYFMYQQPDAHQPQNESTDVKIHSIQQNFIQPNNTRPQNVGAKSTHYSSYFVGNDTTKWKSKVFDYQSAVYEELYDGIKAVYSTSGGQLQYAFQLQSDADVKKIQFEFTGSKDIALDQKGNLIVKHRFGQILQTKPKAWAYANGQQKEINIQFKEHEGVWGFGFPEGLPSYDSLTIDPSLTFSTFSGSSADNWGFTATPDVAGNLYGAGIVFGYGYPTTPGSYDITFNNGVGSLPFDVGITKFNSTGSNLLYSIYFGGSGNETPHSIVTGPTGELYVYGVTCSPNFPTTAGAYDATFNGGPTEVENSLTFNGSDIYLSRFSTNGTNLIASTYVGGSGSDGLNLNSLHYNYGDQFRGEIILDGSGNVLISSTTASMNFPTTAGSFSNVLNGLQDAVVCKFNNTFTNLLWGTFFGGMGEESGNSIEISPNGTVYLAGGSTSPSFPGVSSGNDLSNNGGLSDGYLARINAGTGSVLSATFLGMNEYDQAYFVRCDPSNLVYVYGQTESSWPITAGCTGTPNSGQFLRKYNGNLQNISWTTMFGAGTGHVEISPTAFLVSDCYEIYVAGWGGTLNANSSVSQATHSTTNGFLITPNAYQSNTNGSNFYLSVFSQDAQSVTYGTYMGGLTGSSNHVDGGTSRFDKNGRIYHAVCGACGGNNFGFTSTPGSWSPQNPSPNCNMAVFKFELSTLDAVISQPSPLICIPQPVIFGNNSVNGNNYQWLFGDNTTSTQFQPTHYYNVPGIYNVTLIVSDSSNCYVPDTAVIQVNIGDFQGGVTLPSTAICPGSSYPLDAFGGSNYSWSPANLVSNPNIPNPIATIQSNTVFTVVISDSCGSDTLQVPLNVVPISLTVSNDTSLCVGGSAMLVAVGNGTLLWSPSGSLNTNQGNTVMATPDSTTSYVVSLTSPEGCVLSDTATVFVYYNPPVSNLPDTVILCQGTSTTLSVSGATTYNWSPNQNISTTIGPLVTIWPDSNMYYYCAFTNACGTLIDSVYANILQANVTAGNDTIICPNEIAQLWANGAQHYLWSPSNFIVNQAGNQVWVSPATSTNFQVVGIDSNGCLDTAYVEVVLHPLPSILINNNVQAFYGDQIALDAQGNSPGTYVWSPGEFLSCINCPNPIATPEQDYTYYVNFTDLNGCTADAQVNISYDPIIYVPNAFIPDGNGINDLFGVYGGNIKSMEMLIFNRWGELICTLGSMQEKWDGTYDGKACQDGTYTWKLKYTDKQQHKFALTGHVILLR